MMEEFYSSQKRSFFTEEVTLHGRGHSSDMSLASTTPSTPRTALRSEGPSIGPPESLTVTVTAAAPSIGTLWFSVSTFALHL